MNELVLVLIIVVLILYLYRDPDIKLIIKKSKSIKIIIVLAVIYLLYNGISYNLLLGILLTIALLCTKLGSELKQKGSVYINYLGTMGIEVKDKMGNALGDISNDGGMLNKIADHFNTESKTNKLDIELETNNTDSSSPNEKDDMNGTQESCGYISNFISTLLAKIN